MFKFLFLIILSTQLTQCWSARILGIFPMVSYSHYILGETLFKELASKGHDVTVISRYLQKEKLENYRNIYVEEFKDFMKELDAFTFRSPFSIMNIIAINDLGYLLTEATFKNSNVQELLNSNTTFDLVICEHFFNYAQMAFAHHFKAHLILFSSQPPNEWTKNFLRHPLPFVYVPGGFSEYSYEMITSERIINGFFYLIYDIYEYFLAIPRHNGYLAKYMPDSPTISEIIPTIDLVLYNSHLSTSIAVPMLPNMVEIGGFHIEPKPLPNDLKIFLDEATEGVIYFSMGTNLKSINFPSEKRTALLTTFSKLKQKVLWKWEDDNLQEKPANVKAGKWLPQQDILAHPNVKLFITHNGLLSTIEAVYFGVPTLGIPIFGDQNMNAAISKARGIGLTLDINNITEDSLTETLNELLNNSKYTENAKFRAKIMRDQPMKPMEKAMFWIEYVLRHKGAKHLHVHGIRMPWFQYYMVDLVVIAITVGLIFMLIFWFAKRTCTKCIRKDKKKLKIH